MLIFGHRGAPLIKPENTIASFEMALSQNVDGIELDIQLTSDGEIVVLHDFIIQDQSKIELPVKDLSFNDIQTLYSKIKIPTLDEVCQMFPSDKILNIEIKSQSIHNTKIITKTVKTITKYGLHESSIISSFNPFVLLTIKKLNPRIKIGLLWSQSSTTPWFVTHYSANQLEPYSFHASIHYINDKIANWVIKNNMKLFFYTINTASELNKAKQFNADGIFSDYPNILNTKI